MASASAQSGDVSQVSPDRQRGQVELGFQHAGIPRPALLMESNAQHFASPSRQSRQPGKFSCPGS